MNNWNAGNIALEMKLKPCPFCGGEAEEVRTKEETANPRWYVRCTRCGAQTRETVSPPAHLWDWNRRAIECHHCEKCRHFTQGDGFTYCADLRRKREPGDYCSRFVSYAQGLSTPEQAKAVTV